MVRDEIGSIGEGIGLGVASLCLVQFTDVLGVTVVVTALPRMLADLQASPREKNPDSLGDDFCAICANISLAGAIVLPIVLLFLLGTARSERLTWSFAATRAASTIHVHFDARGPPAA